MSENFALEVDYLDRHEIFTVFYNVTWMDLEALVKYFVLFINIFK